MWRDTCEANNANAASPPRNSKERVRAKPFLTRMAVRAAPFALLTISSVF